MAALRVRREGRDCDHDVIEPVIGHLEEDCRLRRNPLKGALGDALHVFACAAGYNLRRLLR